MKNIPGQGLIKITLLFSSTLHFLFLGLPISRLFISRQVPQREKEFQVRIEVEKPPLLPKIDIMDEEKKLKEVIKESKPPEPELEPQPKQEKVAQESKPEPKEQIEEIMIEEPKPEPSKELIEIINPQEEATLRYQDMVKQRIESYRRYPDWAKKQGSEGIVYLTFIVLSNGVAKDINIIHTSCFDILNNEAVSTIKRANPFAPIPKNLNCSCLKIEVAVVFKLK